MKRVYIISGVILISGFLLLSITGCKKLVEIDAPVTSINEDNVYNSDAMAISVLTGMYMNMNKFGQFTGNASISLFSGLSADEFTLYSGVTGDNYIAYYRNALFANTIGATPGTEHWSILYNYIFTCNAAIEGLSNAAALTPGIKRQLLGEAKFMRAFFYFYLVNLYGDVALVTVTDPTVSGALSRTAKSAVYQQIISDLKDAQELLSPDYLNGALQSYSGGAERVRPTKWAATALLARVFMYTQDWLNAEAQATAVINNQALYKLSTLNEAFLKNSTEAIWQLQPITSGRNTEDAWTFIVPASGPSNVNGPDGNPVFLSQQLLGSFEPADLRKKPGNWINNVTTTAGDTFYFPYKYKSATQDAPVTEYLMVLRLGEQYLIRSEARAQQNKIADAQSDLNTIRTRAGLANTTAADKASLLTAILHERQTELFTEWGNRWLDLKRTNNVDAVLTTVTPLKANGMPWRSYQQWYPLPLNDIQKDPNLAQNSGY